MSIDLPDATRPDTPSSVRPTAPRPDEARAQATDFEPLHRRLETVAARAPGAIAVVDGERRLTHGALHEAASRLAVHLVALGARPGERVAVCLPRGADVVIAFLAVLKTGAAFVPLDPTYPHARRAHKLADARPRAVVTLVGLLADLRAADWTSVLLDDPVVQARLATFPGVPLPVVVGPTDPAYVIYTSGSTGVPKGVVVPHRALAWHARTMVERYDLAADDRVLQFASLAFDICVEEIFPTLAAGATLVLRGAADGERVQDFLCTVSRHELTVLNLPTAFWHELVRGLDVWAGPFPPSVRLLVVGGEKASRTLHARWVAAVGDRPRFLNAYGPTETTVTATVYEPAANPHDHLHAELPIGRPLPGVTCHVLDEALRPVPDGEPGELCIGGEGVALGYLHRPDLTTQRFVPDPHGDRSAARLYRTGDRVRRLPDGHLAFLGREDGQLKIRGFRVECAEVERQIEAHPDVAQAVVVGVPDGAGHTMLWACVQGVPGRSLDEAMLRTFLRARLPAHMLPSRWRSVEGFPTTPGGKVDREALAAQASRVAPGPAPAPAPGPPVTGVAVDDAHADLAGWLAPRFAEVLGVPAVDPDASFFDLGGHSLSALRLLSALARDRPDLDLAPQRLFAHPSVRALARSLGEGGSAAPTVVRLNPASAATDARTPLVCVAGVALYGELARALADDRPVYGVFLPEDVRDDTADGPAPDIGSMAEAYRDRIVAALPQGPVAVAGLSFGGTLALEIARRLQAGGREVRLLVPMDAFTPRTFGALAPLARVQARWRRRRDVRAAPPGQRAEALAEARRQALLDRAEEAYARTRPAWDGPALLVTASGSDRVDPPRRRPDLGWLGRLCPVDLGWRSIVRPDSPVLVVPGDHLGILRPPGVAHIAAAVRGALGEG